MKFEKYSKIEYCVFDPTGNITALVESKVDVADQPAVASAIMDAEPDVEQGDPRDVFDNPQEERTKQFLRVFER